MFANEVLDTTVIENFTIWLKTVPGDKRSSLFCPKKREQLYDNEITSLIDIYFLRISLTPSEPFRHPV
jgi:hypothetical protein